MVLTRRLTAEEYDAVCDELPAAAVGLQRAAGDMRRGAQVADQRRRTCSFSLHARLGAVLDPIIS